MEMLGFKARAPRGIKLSKPPPRKLTTDEIIKERLDNVNFNNGIRELSDLEQSRFVEVNNNEIEKVYRMKPASSDQTELNGSITNNNGCYEDNDNNSLMRQRARAPRVAKLTKPRPLRHRLPSIETGPPTTEPVQTTEQVKDRLPSLETGPPTTEPGQTTEQAKDRQPSIETGPSPTEPGQATEQVKGFTPELFSVKSADEAEDMILSVIEKLSSLDQTSTELFRDILVKYGPQLEEDNPAFIRSCLACVEEFLKRDCADAGVRSILQNVLCLRKQSWNQVSGEQDAENKGDHGNYESKKLDKKSEKNNEQKVSRTVSCDSGYGDQDDVILWTNEDSFIHDLSENLKDYDHGEDDLMADGKKMLANQTKEAMSDKTAHGFLSKHFKPTTTEENPPFYSTETNWSDAVKKPKDSFKGCVNFDTQFTKLKGYPVSDDAKRTDPVRAGFEEFKTKSDSWISGSRQNVGRYRTDDDKFFSHSGSDQESWRKPLNRQGFGNPGKMFTVPEEDNTSNGITSVIPQRPKHLILKDRISSREGHCKIVVERQPLGPGSDPSVIVKVEEGLPKSIYSAAGRRTMFKKYNTAVCIDDIDSDDLEELEPVTYSREELLTLANSPLSRKRPTESSYLCKLYPEVCLEKAEAYYSSRDYQKPSTSYVKQKREQSENYFVSNNLECKSQEPNPESHRFGFQTREQNFEFGSHKNFPRTSVLGPSAFAQEHSKPVFGSNSNFIPKDFRSCAPSTENSDEGSTFMFQRNGFGKPF